MPFALRGPSYRWLTLHSSYNSCYQSFDSCYPKPECRDEKCSKCEYQSDDCGNRYGGYVTMLHPYIHIPAHKVIILS